jgi:hypothetical protein
MRSTRTRDRLGRLVSPAGQPWRKKTLERERRRELTKERRTKSPRGIELSIEENPNRHKEETWNRETFEGGRTRLEKLFRRERVSDLFFENKHTSLTGMTYWSALANRINSTKMDMAINFDQD